MLRVRVKRVTAQIAAASGMAAAASAMGCADLGAEAPRDDAQEEDVNEAKSPFFGGEVKFDISGWPGGVETVDFVISEATTDEFLRVGQKLTFDFPAITLWDWLHPGAPPPALSDLQKLHATIEIVAHDEGKPFATLKAQTVSFSGNDIFSLRAVTDTVVIPHKTDQLQFSMFIEDPPGNKQLTLTKDVFVPQPVFGGALPEKSLLFDSTPGFRQRVIEGDDPVAGASLRIGYTDYRADTLVDASMIDRQIGTQMQSGRFGQVTVPLFGTLEHEVSYAVMFDDGAGWQAEAALQPEKSSRFLGAGRTSYEAEIAISGKATGMSMYLHVKTYLVATYPNGAGITKWYGDGEKVLKADKYDNPGGQAFVNYEFSIEN